MSGNWIVECEEIYRAAVAERDRAVERHGALRAACAAAGCEGAEEAVRGLAAVAAEARALDRIARAAAGAAEGGGPGWLPEVALAAGGEAAAKAQLAAEMLEGLAGASPDAALSEACDGAGEDARAVAALADEVARKAEAIDWPDGIRVRQEGA